ncbi:flagellar basal-body MS-ring/collar protein FliF [Qipengyuania sp.]|uniref:flagellar basal-body MS-ring/collar protein FliF n=1 Tax=Qipengyuania sp. TaxID=2004515 RepID=UPI0035C7FB48
MREPAMRKILPWFVGAGGLGLAALTFAMLSPAPQRILYSSIDDQDRAGVVAALDQAGIGYEIDNGSGAISVAEDDVYKARMVVASNGALAAPESGSTMLENLPLGASRTLEGDRLRAARERDLEMTIAEIDSVESVRVHLAQPERSVFVRDTSPPSASVMLRLRNGRSVSEAQVGAIANLVAASVPGLSTDQVRIVDQHGKLLSEASGESGERLQYQSDMEAKLRGQVSQLLTPMFGAGKFSAEAQVEIDMSETTSARESYDKDGVVRTESQSQSTNSQEQAGGVPGATTNIAPADPQAEERAPVGGENGNAGVQNGQSQMNRTYELGREVAVASTQPGDLKRLTVAVAIDEAVLKNAKPADLTRLEELISAAVGANPQRGDVVKVIARSFEATPEVETPIYEESWFLTLVRYGAAVLGTLLVLLLGVRPMIKAVRERNRALTQMDEASQEGADDREGESASDDEIADVAGSPVQSSGDKPNAQVLEQVELARRIAREQPDDALGALRSLLAADRKEAA